MKISVSRPMSIIIGISRQGKNFQALKKNGSYIIITDLGKGR